MSAKWFAILIVAMVTNLPVLADEPGSDSADERGSGTDRSLQAATQPRTGLSVRVDPETGEILGYRRAEPPAERLEQPLSEALSRSDEGLRQMTLPDGSVRVDLQGRFRHLNAARLGRSGEIEQICADHFHLLTGFLNTHSEIGGSAQEGRKHEND